MKQHTIKNNLLLLAICLASFVGCLDLTVVNTALPAIKQTFHTDVDTLQWVMTGLFAALSGTMVLTGKMADIFGHRRMMLIGLCIFGVSSLLAGQASSMLVLILARIFQGFGIAILYTAPPAFINHTFEKEAVPKVMGYYFAASSLGIASGPLIGGFIVAALNWQWIFYLNIPLVLLSLSVIIVYSSPIEISKKETLDISGACLLIGGLMFLLLATSYIGKHILWGSIFLLLALLGFICFLFYEKKIQYPLLDLQLFRYPTFTLGGLANMALACFYTNAFFLMPMYLSIVKHCDALHIGLILLPATLTLTIFSPLVNKWVERFSVWKVLITGFSFFAINALIQSTFEETTPLWWIMLIYSFIGIGWACILSPSFSSALISIPQEKSGVAMGALGTLHNAGGSIGLAIGAILFGDTTSSALSPQELIANQTRPFLFIAVIATIMVTVLYLKSQKEEAKKHVD